MIFFSFDCLFGDLVCGVNRLCMQVWSRDPITSQLTRNTLHAMTSSKLDLTMALTASLQDRFYPIRTSLSSPIRLSEANSNNFEFKTQFINTLAKFHSLESKNAYFFIREFEKVCLKMRIPM